MKNILVIRQGRIVLEQAAEQEKMLALKICVGTTIHKFDQLMWSQPCQRWETTSEIKINYPKGEPIDLELYYPSKSIPKVVGEATIDMEIFSRHLEEEIKIALTYDGMIKGWLYCQIGLQGQGPLKIESKYLYIHKISFHFLEDYENQFCLEIFQNTQPIYEKKFILTQTSKTLFPNIKNSIRYSDVIRISLNNQQSKFRTISFLVDTIKRGKTAYYETWLRNKYNNKIGDVKVEYFLENLFLQNDRRVLSRKPVDPKTLSRISSLISQANSTHTTAASLLQDHACKKIEETQETESLSRLSEKDLNKMRTTFKVRRKEGKVNTAWKSPVGTDSENTTPYLKRKNNTIMKQINKKQSFYFQLPFE